MAEASGSLARAHSPTSTKATIAMTRKMASESSNGLVGTDTRGSTKMMKEMDMVK